MSRSTGSTAVRSTAGRSIAPPAIPAPGHAPASRTGAQVMCEALIRENVSVMFGIPGGCIMPFYHAMWEYRARLRHVLCRHEQGAGHAAEGFARATGQVGVCIGTSGPGATNLVTPIADAWMDGTPLVAITGQVPSALLGTDAFQETDITGITVPITKHNFLVTNATELPRVFREAFHIARSGRPGPVLIDITKDAQLARFVPDWDEPMDLPGYRPMSQRDDVDQAAIRAAAQLLQDARRPVILAGNGVIQSGATRELRALAEQAGIPVISTLHGLGAMPHDHPLSLGMPGMHGWVHVNRAIQACDVLLNVGSRFDDRVTGKASTFAPHAQIIHIDIDGAEIGKLVRTDVKIVADAKPALRSIAVALPVGSTVARQAWIHEILAMRDEHQPRQGYTRRERTAPLMPHDVFDAMNAAFRDRSDWRVVTDVGQHQMWAAQLLDWSRPRTHITSGGAGTMGFALPAAMGAAIADPSRTIWVVVGDGGFQMTSCELATIAQEGLTNVKVAIVNNGYLGMVRQWQQLFEGKRYSGTPLTGPDFAKLAEAHGLRGFTVDDAADAPAAIEAAWKYRGCAVIDFRVEREANVFPIVPAGQAIGDMLMAPPATPAVPAVPSPFAQA
ncbi:MAG: biosynthetic-type acetolactate synthase large subunit [Gemmatimonadaceae bacterium]|nr:biosynthetic-type acetolactate synthase large subunit [Gemmatimonadaceae bacterium]